MINVVISRVPVALRVAAIALAATSAAGAFGNSSHQVEFQPARFASMIAHSAIVGGSLAEGSFFASLAFVRDVRGNEVGECAGTVVARDAVLTAGHCAED